MKKIITLASFFIMAFATGAFAQYDTGAPAQYRKGDILVNAGLSVGMFGYGYGFYGSSSGFLPVSVNVEYSLNEQFAVGPYVGIYSKTYHYLTFKDRFTALSFGARGTFHASAFLNDHLDLGVNEEKLDLYATMIIGIESRSWKMDDAYEGARYYDNDVYFDFGPVLGARYHFNPTLSAFFEAGRGSFGLGTLGVTAKF